MLRRSESILNVVRHTKSPYEVNYRTNTVITSAVVFPAALEHDVNEQLDNLEARLGLRK
jgi:hypothetical protein